MRIGILGTGSMGQRVAPELANRGHEVLCFDSNAMNMNLHALMRVIDPKVKVLNDGREVCANSDMVLYLVPTERIEEAARAFGPSSRPGSLVCSGTSVMEPAVDAFVRNTSRSVNIVNWHLLCAPNVKDLTSQASALVRVRSTDSAYENARTTLGGIGTRLIEIDSYSEHDKMMADTQATTQMAFLSMGRTWQNTGVFPWESQAMVGGIDNVKMLMMLRILNGQAHVYGGIAILNRHAREQVTQYASAVAELFEMMERGDERGFREKVLNSRDFVFGDSNTEPILSDKLMRGHSLNGHVQGEATPNSHLSLLAMPIAWQSLGIKPQKNLICSTPPFLFRFGIVEHLLNNNALLDEAITTAFRNPEIVGHDRHFRDAVLELSGIIREGDLEAFKSIFDGMQTFFKKSLDVGLRVSNSLIGAFGSEQSRQYQ